MSALRASKLAALEVDQIKPHYSIRLSEDEQARVQQAADAQHLPPSTLVRSWILDRLNQDKTA